MATKAWPRVPAVVLAASMFVGVPLAGAERGPSELGPTPRIGGFSDFNFFADDDEAKASPQSGFVEGQFVLHFVSQLSNRLSFFGELTLSARSSEFKPEVERTIIRYDVADQLKVSFGRYHTPINWWNTAFHHGQWLQTSVSRPEMTKFGGDFIPVHFVGGLVEGTFPLSGINLNYKAGLGNGRHSIISRGGDTGDVNDTRAWLVGLFARPDALYPLELGGSHYRDRVDLATDGEFDETIWSAYAVWKKETPELLAEVSWVSHEDRATGMLYDSWAWYAQAAWRLPFANEHLKPYGRYERTGIADGDAVFSKLVDRNAGIIGLRYDFSELAAIKFEFRNVRETGAERIHAFFTQISFAF